MFFKKYTVRPDEPGYIYIILDPDWPGEYKVGITTDPDWRLLTYENGDPNLDRIYEVEHFDKTRLSKRQVQAALKQFLRRNEWIGGELDDIKVAIDDQGQQEPRGLAERLAGLAKPLARELWLPALFVLLLWQLPNLIEWLVGRTVPGAD